MPVKRVEKTPMPERDAVLRSHDFGEVNEGYGMAHAQFEDSDLEVYGQPGAAGPAYFCAAAEFAVRYQKRSRAEYLFVVRPEADSETRSGFRSVLFRVVSKDEIGDLPPNGATVSVTRAGEHRTVAFAEQLC